MRRGQIGLTIDAGDHEKAAASARVIMDQHSSMTVEVAGGIIKITTSPGQACHLRSFEEHAEGKFETKRHGTWPN